MDIPFEFDGKYMKYHKIEETSKNWELSKNDQNKIKRHKFCVTEKAHGTNFVFIVLGKNKIVCGKRKGLLSLAEYFYGYKTLIKKYEKVLYHLYTRMKKPKKLYVYGELLGGFYPVDGKLDNMMDAVQTGIWYCPDIDFYAFDMAVETGEGFRFLDFDTCLDCFKSSGIICAEPLFIGTLDECLNFDINFKSKIPSFLRQQALPNSIENKAEGIVIKPMKEFQVTSKGILIRPMLKRKITEFSEKIYDETVKSKMLESRKFGEREILMFEIQALVNQNRLNNAISKYGKVSEKERKKVKMLLKEFHGDVINQLIQDNDKEWYFFSETERLELSEYANSLCKECIINFFKETRKQLREKRMKKKL